MFMMPFQVLALWLRALLSMALLGGAITLLTLWYVNRERPIVERRNAEGTWVAVDERPADAPDNADRRTRWVSWEFGLNRETAFLLGGAALLLWSLGGGLVVHPLLWRRAGSRPDSPVGEKHRIKRPDGTELHVELFGPPNGVPLVLIHGWSLHSDEWAYAKTELARTHRLIVWDLAGLGHSGMPDNRDFSLAKMAHDLDAVIEAVSFNPVVLVGHSIGGMIILTYCKLFPEKMGQRVRSLVIAQSTYTNPVKTTRLSGLMQALQKPLLEPLAHLMVWLSPVVRVFNWMSYLNGSAHRSTERSAFTGRETRGQLDALTRQYVESNPAAIGRGFLAMFEYDASDVLPGITVPVLIITADRDNTCVPEASEHMARVIPSARLTRLGDGRHCAVYEFHEQFHAAVIDFVAASEMEAEQRVITEAARTTAGS